MRTALLTRTVLACLVLSLAASPSVDAWARGKAKAAKQAPKLDTGAIEAQLKSRDAGRIREGLESARQAAAAASPVAGTVEQLLGDGLPADLTVLAIQTLGAIRAESSSRVLSGYARHRDPKIRRQAAKALERTGGAEAIKALRRCLSDGDVEVRSLGAAGLGNLGAKQYVPALFLALEQLNERRH